MEELKLTLQGQEAQDYLDYLAEMKAKERIGRLREDALIAMEEILLIWTEAERKGHTLEYAMEQANRKIDAFKETNYLE